MSEGELNYLSFLSLEMDFIESFLRKEVIKEGAVRNAKIPGKKLSPSLRSGRLSIISSNKNVMVFFRIW